MPNKAALIGHTGFVGSTLKAAGTYTHFYNSSNIESIQGEQFDTITCAGAPAAMWIANANPEMDKNNINRLISSIAKSQTKKFNLISTVAVFSNLIGVDENTSVNAADLAPYGAHRYELENFVRTNFKQFNIVRLPALFGPGLKKNALYDLINNNNVDQIPIDAVFQWYNVTHLYKDLERISDLPLVHLATEPISMRTLIQRLFPDMRQVGRTGNTPHNDVRTIYGERFGNSSRYIANAETSFREISSFIDAERRRIQERIA